MTEQQYLETFVQEYKYEVELQKEKNGTWSMSEILEAVETLHDSN